jgi:hypothetical protein
MDRQRYSPPISVWRAGLAFDGDGTLLVGDGPADLSSRPRRTATAFATLPSSVAAFHLALAPDGALCVTGQTLAS